MNRLMLSRILLIGLLCLLLHACAKSDKDDKSANTTCDQVCSISNGATAAVGGTYWKISGLACGQGVCFTKIAFFDDGTGKLISGTNNCILNSAPVAVAFSWTKTGANTLLLSEAPFACAPEQKTTSGTIIGSFTASTGGVSTGVFKSNVNGTGSIQASLLSGTF